MRGISGCKDTENIINKKFAGRDTLQTAVNSHILSYTNRGIIFSNLPINPQRFVT